MSLDPQPLPKRLKSLSLVFLALGALLAALSLHDPFLEDEAILARLAVHWAKVGPKIDELYHTPLHLDLLGLWWRLFHNLGSETVVLRSFGWTLGLVNLWIVFRMIQKLAERTDLAWLGVLLLGVHPYWLQGTLLLDVDNTIHTTFLLLFAYFVEQSFQPANFWKNSTLAAFLLATAAMTKELTPVLALGIWCLYAMLTHLRHSFRVALAAGGSILLFLVMLWTWGKVYDVPLLTPLEFTLHRASGGYTRPPWERMQGLGRFLFGTWSVFLWFGLPFLAWWQGIFLRSKHPVSDLRSWLSFPSFLGLSVLGAYTWITQQSYYFPKYSYPALPLLVVGGCLALSRQSADPPIRVSQLLWGLPPLGLLPLLNASFDPLYLIEARREMEWSQVLILTLSVALAAALSLWAGIQTGIRSAPFLASYFLALSLSQNFAPYETRYQYGEQGFEETLAFVRENFLKSDRPILSPAIDLAWALGERASVVIGEDPSVVRIDPRSSKDHSSSRLLSPNAIWLGRNHSYSSLLGERFTQYLAPMNCEVKLPKNRPRFIVRWKDHDCKSPPN